MNIFDNAKRKVFDTVVHVMGYDAVWTSSIIGNSQLTARVGYKDPSEKQELSGIDSWNPNQPFMEYRVDSFIGLKERVDSGNLEHVEIAGIGYFAIQEIQTKIDGDVYVARLIRVTP